MGDGGQAMPRCWRDDQDESLLWAGEVGVALSGHLKVPLYAATLMGHAAPPSPAPTGLFFIKLCPCVNSREADQNNNFMQSNITINEQIQSLHACRHLWTLSLEDF